MTKLSTKQNPPPYPRPVPEIIAEELPPQPEDVAYYRRADRASKFGIGTNTDAESEANQRAAKRRRIEAKAQSYLRGESLYIMSAQLKGPLGGNWKNPWASRKSEMSLGRSVRTPCLEVQETVVREHRIAGMDKRRSGAGEEAGKQLRVQARERMDKNDESKKGRNGAQANDTRIKEWLRTSDAFADRNGEPQGSPTPTTGHDKKPSSVQLKATDTCNEKRSHTENLNNVHTLAEQTTAGQTRQENPGLTQLNYKKQVSPKAPEQAAQHESVHAGHPAQATSSQTTRNDTAHPKGAVTRSKASALQVAPPAADLSPFEYRRAPKAEVSNQVQTTNSALEHDTDETRKRLLSSTSEIRDQDRAYSICQATNDLPDEAIRIDGAVTTTETGVIYSDASKASITLAEQQNRQQLPGFSGVTDDPLDKPVSALTAVASAIPTDTQHPLPSTTPSEINTADLLPSAQEPPTLLPMPSTGVNDSSMLIMDPVVAGEGLSATSTSVVIPIHLIDSPPGDVAAKAISATEPTYKSPSDIPPRATQDILAEITPFAFSTAKKVKNASERETPTTVTKSRPAERKKKASFICEPQSSVSSHGSIQRSMNAKIGKIQGSPPPLVLQKGATDVSSPVETESNILYKQSKNLFRENTTSSMPPKGILRNTNPASSPSATRRSKKFFSTGQEQVGHAIPIGSGQNAGLDEETFDLDAAIDDLGSFLGTWDVEKEASSLTA